MIRLALPPHHYLFLRTPRARSSTLFPYTTLFRSLPLERERPPRIRGRGPAAHPARDHVVEEDDRRGAERERRDRDEQRSEEHTSELQSRQYLVCRLLLEKKNKLRPTPGRHYPRRY